MTPVTRSVQSVVQDSVTLLDSVYKTYTGALKRARLENAMAQDQFERGDKTRRHHYGAVRVNGLWRVECAVIHIVNMQGRE
jgi:hypothetical protein